MGLFDRFRKRKPEPARVVADEYDLTSLCYAVAYLVLPHYAFRDFGKIAEMWRKTPTSVGPFFYLMACQMQGREARPADATKLRSHHGRLDDSCDFYALEYADPPPIDLSDVDVTRIEPDELPTLGPYFSAAVFERETEDVSYFVLGQSPMGGGTTFREVTSDGMNCNLGPGPEPRLEAFLGRVRAARGTPRR